MKMNSNRFRVIVTAISIVCLVWCGSGSRAEEMPVGGGGFIRIVNGVSHGSGNVSVRVDDREIYAPGYKAGAVTGGIGLSPGGHRVTFSRDGVATGRTRITVETGMTLTLICYSEVATQADGEVDRPKVKILRLKAKESEKGKIATFVSVSRLPELRVDLQGSDKKRQEIRVKRLATSELPVEQVRGYVALRSGGRPLEAIPVAEDGNYVVVLFDDANGSLRSVSFRDWGMLAGD